MRDRQLVIVGSGSQARYVLDAVQAGARVQVAGIVDLENTNNVGNVVNGFRVECVLDDIAVRFPPDRYLLVLAYGKNRRKAELASSLAAAGYEFCTIVHPRAYVATSAVIGPGCIVNPNATILPNADLGAHVIVHSGSVVEHDNRLCDFANIAPGVAFGGRVTVGEGAYVYTGASVLPDIRIGTWAVVGAGAVVNHDVPDGETVVGVPARSIHTRRHRT